MTFRAWFYRTDPQHIGGQFGTLSGLWRNTFRKRTSQKKPRNIYFKPKSFRTIFEKRTPVYSLAAPLLGLAKSIYYLVVPGTAVWSQTTPSGISTFNVLSFRIKASLCSIGSIVYQPCGTSQTFKLG